MHKRHLETMSYLNHPMDFDDTDIELAADLASFLAVREATTYTNNYGSN